MSISEVRRRALRQDLIDPVDENCCGTCNMLQSFKDGQHRSIGLENPPFLDLCFGCFRKKNIDFHAISAGTTVEKLDTARPSVNNHGNLTNR